MCGVTQKNGLCLGFFFFYYNIIIYFLGHAKGHAAQIWLLSIIPNGHRGKFADPQHLFLT